MTNAPKSSSPSGNPRAGRRERERSRPAGPTPFLERYRGWIVAVAVIAGIGLVGGFVFLSATSPSYACSTVWQDPEPDPDPERMGAPQDDMGNAHVRLNEFVRYTFCPPASGSHVNRSGQGPIQARFYGPDDQAVPQGWVHNLEHGAMVVLYSCDEGDGCGDAAQDGLQALFDDFPDSPVCGVPAGRNGPVIARFEDMPAPYATLVWGRVEYWDTLDSDGFLEFFATEAERANPEPQCPPPSPSPSPAASPSPSPG